ncbi:hypothetical protein Tco_1359124, partial [Tanacetum coccineum]
TMGAHDDKPDPHVPNDLDNTRRWRKLCFHVSITCYSEAIDEMLTIKLCVAGTNEEIFTSEACTNAFNIDERIYSELCHEFYSTYEFDEFAKRLGLYNSKEIEEEGFDMYFQGGLRTDEHFNAQEYWLSISREENLSLSRSHASSIKESSLMACVRERLGAGSQKESMICYGQFITKIFKRKNLLSKEVLNSLSAPI